MKVLFDHQNLSKQLTGGVSRYFVELLMGLNNLPDVEIDLALRYSPNLYLRKKGFESERLSWIEGYKYDFLYGSRKAIPIIGRLKNYLLEKNRHKNKCESLRKLKENNFDIFHPTYYDNYFLSNIGNKPFVVTVFDMIFECHPRNRGIKDEIKQNKKNLIERADRVIAISQSTKSDILNCYDIKPEKIDVVYLAPSLIEDKTPNDFSCDYDNLRKNKYLLFIGRRGGYKNFVRFLKAISKLLQENKELELICVGGGPFSKDERLLFKSCEIEGQVSQFFVEDSKLRSLYHNAIAFVYPSEYEGFGIPLVEAFQTGCAVVCSDIPVFKEVANDAAIYFEPSSIDSIQHAIRSVIEDSSLRKDLIESGKNRLKYFSWEITAEMTKKVYEKALYNRD